MTVLEHSFHEVLRSVKLPLLEPQHKCGGMCTLNMMSPFVEVSPFCSKQNIVSKMLSEVGGGGGGLMKS